MTHGLLDEYVVVKPYQDVSVLPPTVEGTIFKRSMGGYYQHYLNGERVKGRQTAEWRVQELVQIGHLKEKQNA
jgi:hypothetical protein